MKHATAGEDEFSFIECYYDDDQNLVGWCPHELAGESLHDLHGQLQRLLFVVTEAIALRTEGTSHRSHRGLVLADDLPTCDTLDELAARAEAFEMGDSDRAGRAV